LNKFVVDPDALKWRWWWCWRARRRTTSWAAASCARLGIVHQAGHDQSVVAVLVRLRYPVQEARWAA